MPPDRAAAIIRRAKTSDLQASSQSWRFWRLAAQAEPEGDWRIWLVMAGRGFGKTRMGAEWVRERAESDGDLRIALVAATIVEARAVMIEGESGLLASAAGGILLVVRALARRRGSLNALKRAQRAGTGDEVRGTMALAGRNVGVSGGFEGLPSEHDPLSSGCGAMLPEREALSSEHGLMSAEHDLDSGKHAFMSPEHGLPSSEHDLVSSGLGDTSRRHEALSG